LQKILFIVFIVFGIGEIHSQTQKLVSFKGTLVDSTDNQPVIGAVIRLVGTKNYISTTNVSGDFSFSCEQDNYNLKITMIGYDSIVRPIKIVKDVTLKFKLNERANILKEVSVTAEQDLVKLKGDTVEHNAAAYKLNPDATAEDLVKKLPGTTIENGTVKSNGEEIKKVTVDGKDFFGDDVSMTLKNLPADMVNSVQVYDRASDQSNLTGFNDGNTTKAMNIKTKNGFKNSIFGKAYGGYGTEQRYDAGGNINYFSGNRRISLISNFNNINQQNFAMQDVLGVMGMGNMPRMPGMGSMNSTMMQGMMANMPGGSDMANFFTSQQSGVNEVNAIGLNYSDYWGKKVSVSGSYFFNYNINTLESNLLRKYFLDGDQNQIYTELTSSKADNINHRFNFRLQYDIDSANSFVLTPRLTYQDNSTTKLFSSQTDFQELILNQNNTNTNSKNEGFMLSGSALYTHKFARKGRTFSFNMSVDDNQSEGHSYLKSNTYYLDSLVNQDQYTKNKGDGKSYSANLSYTEPILKSGQLAISYYTSFTNSHNNKSNYFYNDASGSYNEFNGSLSNEYNYDTYSNKASIQYAYNKKKVNFSIGSSLQNQRIEGVQLYPTNFTVANGFTNILPSASISYRFSGFQSIRLNYKATTNLPGISQLQNVIDNSNPTNLSTGNSNLKQEYDHNFTLRYNKINLASGKMMFGFVNARFSDNYIGNNTSIFMNDTIINGFKINQGSQLTKTENLKGFSSLTSFFTYGFKVRPIKSNLNLNLGANYSRTPVSINNKSNISESSTLTGGLSLSSNISKKIDFTIGYTGNYNISLNSLQNSTNNNYYNDNIDVKIVLTIWKGLVFSSEYSRVVNYGLSSGYNQQRNLLTSSMAYKLLKKRQLEVKATLFDVLKENNNLNRTISANYLEDSRSNVLTQYWLFTLTYTFKKFNSA